MERGGRVEAALRSTGQAVPSVVGQVAARRAAVVLIILPVLQPVQTHEGELSERREPVRPHVCIPPPGRLYHESTHKMLSKGHGVESRAVSRQLIRLLLSQFCRHNEELSVQSGFSRLANCQTRQTDVGDRGLYSHQ